MLGHKLALMHARGEWERQLERWAAWSAGLHHWLQFNQDMGIKTTFGGVFIRKNESKDQMDEVYNMFVKYLVRVKDVPPPSVKGGQSAVLVLNMIFDWQVIGLDSWAAVRAHANTHVPADKTFISHDDYLRMLDWISHKVWGEGEPNLYNVTGYFMELGVRVYRTATPRIRLRGPGLQIR